MITLSKIRLPNGTTQWCVLRGGASDLKRIRFSNFEEHAVEASSSDTFLDSAQGLFLKAPKLRRRWLDNLAKLFLQTPACKETRGNRALRKLGLCTPDILARAIPLNPFGHYRSLLYCSYIASAVPLNEYMRQNSQSGIRAELLKQVGQQMSIMLEAGIFFRDFYFGNILLTSSLALVWIDTEIRQYPIRKNKARRHLQKRKQFMSERFLRDGGKEAEWPAFFESLT